RVGGRLSADQPHVLHGGGRDPGRYLRSRVIPALRHRVPGGVRVGQPHGGRGGRGRVLAPRRRFARIPAARAPGFALGGLDRWSVAPRSYVDGVGVELAAKTFAGRLSLSASGNPHRSWPIIEVDLGYPF